MPLYRLPNGAWIFPETITQILPRPGGTNHAGPYPCSVTIMHSQDSIRLEFLSLEDAERFADELAAVVNARSVEKVEPEVVPAKVPAVYTRWYNAEEMSFIYNGAGYDYSPSPSEKAETKFVAVEQLRDPEFTDGKKLREYLELFREGEL